jgi:hypothetical protein
MMKLLNTTVLVGLLLLGAASAQSAFAQVEGPPLRPDSVKTGSISGQLLTTGGEPLAGGMVYFFDTTVGPPPAHEKYWRVPDFMKRLDNEGRFTIALPDGQYYMGGTWKPAGKPIGPPRDGDYFFISADDKGMPLTYNVRSNAPINLGKIARAVPFKSSTASYGKGITAIEGTVLDDEGKPVEGAFVFAFVSATKVGRPLFTSDPTGKDGKFILRVNDSGKYYLKVRSMYGGGPPVAGEIIGNYGEKEPLAVSVQKGDRLTGLSIKVRKFLGRGPRAGVK